MKLTLDAKTLSLKLRQAQADDAPLLVSILHAAFAEYQGLLDPPAGVHHETNESVLLKLEKGRAVLAYVGAEAAGCVFYRPENGYMYLGRLAVLPPYRTHGVASALLNYVEQVAGDQRFRRVQLGVRIELPRLHAYYAQRGYQTVRYGTHEGYAEPTYVIMEKALPQRGPTEDPS